MADLRYQYKARTITQYLNRLVLGNVCEIELASTPIIVGSGVEYYPTALAEWYLNRIRWPAEASVTTWEHKTAGFYDLPNQGDPILRFGVFKNNDMAVFREKSVYRVSPSPDPYQLIVDQGAQTVKGIWAANSLQKIHTTPRAFNASFRLAEAESFIYLGRDDFYVLDLNSWESVGAPIRTEFFRVVDPSRLLNAWSFQDVNDKKYYLVTYLKDGTQHAWIYDWEEKTWARQDFSDYLAVGEWNAASLGVARSLIINDTVSPTEALSPYHYISHEPLLTQQPMTDIVTPQEAVAMNLAHSEGVAPTAYKRTQQDTVLPSESVSTVPGKVVAITLTVT